MPHQETIEAITQGIIDHLTYDSHLKQRIIAYTNPHQADDEPAIDINIIDAHRAHIGLISPPSSN